MTELLVLGVGSPFADDQLGFRVIELLKARTNLNRFPKTLLEMDCLDRPGMLLLQRVFKAKRVILIDAMQSGLTIGSCKRFEDKSLFCEAYPLSSHGIGVSQAIKLGDILHMIPEYFVIYGIEIGDTHFEFKTSTVIKEAISRVSEQIAEEIIRVLN